MTDASDPGITPPVVNLNGTPKQMLLDQHLAVMHAIRVLEHLMIDALPHGRDFQTAPPGRYEMARAQATARLRLISRLHAEFEALALAISEQ